VKNIFSRCKDFKPEDRGFIVECSHCGKPQDKRKAAERGKWIHTLDPLELNEKGKPIANYIGFHINQLYMPLYSKQDILNQKPENNPLSDEMSWNNEVLGEFYSGDSATITTEQIKSMCGDYKRPMVKQIRPIDCTNDRNVYLGIDWGKKIDANITAKDGTLISSKGQSYTVAAKRVVGDIGYGHEIMGELQHQYGLKVLASEAVGTKIKGRIKFDDTDFPKTIRFEKDNQIEEFFNLLRKGSIRFPMKSWEQIAWLVNHCSSMVAKPIGDRYGNVKVRYSKGIAPNDGLMALINAYLAYKFDATGGFKNNAKIFSDDVQEQSRALAIGIYCPAMKIVG